MTKNLITRDENNQYTLTTPDGKTYPCTRWYEKKTNAWHVKLPKDNPTGRTYVRESLFINDKYYFDDKTEHRTGLTAGGWRSKMTKEEARQVEEAEKLIERIKNEASQRVTPKVDMNSIEGIEMMIKRLEEKREKLKNN